MNEEKDDIITQTALEAESLLADIEPRFRKFNKAKSIKQNLTDYLRTNEQTQFEYRLFKERKNA
jgi:hypothetical protein